MGSNPTVGFFSRAKFWLFEHRHHPEHPVEGEQEQDRQQKADGTRQQALVERLLAERGRDLRLRDQLELDRQRADAQVLRQVLGVLEVADAVDLRARGAVDALRVVDVAQLARAPLS